MANEHKRTNKGHLRNSAERARAFAADLVAELAETTAAAFDEIERRMSTYINVQAELGFGSSAAPIDLSTLGIADHTVLYFAKGTYYVSPLDLSGTQNVTLMLHEAVINATGNYIITGKSCPHFSVFGGEINGADKAQYGIELDDSKNIVFDGVTFRDFGNTSLEDVAMLRIFGDCTGFTVTNCTFDTTNAGIVSSDGYIHGYGILINRLGSSNTYPKSGRIRNCWFDNITTADNGTQKGDGDGIFVQAPPYISGSMTIRPECKITIENCVFRNCKKRGIKSRARGMEIRNCDFEGAYWYACIDLQEGHNVVRNCRLINTSDYNNSVTSAIVASDGGFTVDGCYISAPYSDTAFHPGVRFTTRLPGSVIPATEVWDTCYINDCYFDKCSRGVYAYNSNTGVDTYTLQGLEVTNCRFGVCNQQHGMYVSATIFPTVNVFKFVDFRFDYGKNRAEVRAINTTFSYPLSIDSNVVYNFDLYSKYWTNEPMSGYNNLPTAFHTCIIYEGDGMGGIPYKKYTSHGSEIVGTRDPEAVTSTLGKQLLYNSKIGDRYINSSNGNMWVCTAAGTASTVGTWKQVTVA